MPPSSGPINTAPALVKRGSRPDHRPLARRAHDQNPCDRRRAGQSAGDQPHRGQVQDITQAEALVALVEPEARLADKGYDADHFVERLKVRAIKPSNQIARSTAIATSRSMPSATSSSGSSI